MTARLAMTLASIALAGCVTPAGLPGEETSPESLAPTPPGPQPPQPPRPQTPALVITRWLNDLSYNATLVVSTFNGSQEKPNVQGAVEVYVPAARPGWVADWHVERRELPCTADTWAIFAEVWVEHDSARTRAKKTELVPAGCPGPQQVRAGHAATGDYILLESAPS